MKRILLIMTVFALTNCTVIDSYLLTHYDPNEYAQINNIRSQANSYVVDCNDATKSAVNAATISKSTQEFEFYSQHIPRNDDGYKMAQNINEMAQGLKKQYETNAKVSPIFCKFKFQGIERSAEIAQKTVGARPR
jgi:hypothetical protein